MTLLDALKALKIFLEHEVASKIELQKEGTGVSEGEPLEFVNPYVALCHMPHKNFQPMGFETPYMLVGLDEGDDDGQENTPYIRISLATYGGGFYPDKNDNSTRIPDAEGYIDILNLIELIKQALANNPVIGGQLRVERPFRYGLYDSQDIWPYWFGYISFPINIPAAEYTMKGEY